MCFQMPGGVPGRHGLAIGDGAVCRRMRHHQPTAPNAFGTGSDISLRTTRLPTAPDIFHRMNWVDMITY